MQRPSMFGGELYFQLRLRDLAFIDGKSDALRSRIKELKAAGSLHRSVCEAGSSDDSLGSMVRPTKVASVYARSSG